MKKLNLDQVLALKSRLGKKTVSLSALLFSHAVRTALNEADEAWTASLSLRFFEQFKNCWDSKDARFFRDLADCIERQNTNRNRIEQWLYDRLFTRGEQTSKPTGDALLAELKEAGFRIYSERQLHRHMDKIGAITKNSKKQPESLISTWYPGCPYPKP